MELRFWPNNVSGNLLIDNQTLDDLAIPKHYISQKAFQIWIRQCNYFPEKSSICNIKCFSILSREKFNL